jgi:hypothetical protein
MVYILAADGRDEDVARQFKRYRAYIESVSARFPHSAFMLVTSDWYFSPTDPRCPHDSWLEASEFREHVSGGERHEIRSLSLTMRLVGAYHDGHIELRYPKVYAYSLASDGSDGGHGDWRYDELRLSERGNLVHEIEWWSMGARCTWLIEASDLELTWLPASQTR